MIQGGFNVSQLNWIRTGMQHTETVLLIHAVGYDLTYWDRQIEVLAQSYTVVAFDLPGHGLTPGRPEDWSFDSAVDLVSGLIESIGVEAVHLVGISFGGMIAQSLVLARPDLVCSLTLMATACTFTEPARAAMRDRAKALREGGMGAVLQPSLERWFTPEMRAQRPDVMDRVCKTVLGDDPLIQAAIWEIIAKFDVSGRLGEIKCPTLVLGGEEDCSTPPEAAAVLAEQIAGAKLVVLPRSAHILSVETPNTVTAELLAFLSAYDRDDLRAQN